MVARINVGRLTSLKFAHNSNTSGRYLGYGWSVKLEGRSITVQVYDNKYLVKEVKSMLTDKLMSHLEWVAHLVVKLHIAECDNKF